MITSHEKREYCSCNICAIRTHEGACTCSTSTGVCLPFRLLSRLILSLLFSSRNTSRAISWIRMINTLLHFHFLFFTTFAFNLAIWLANLPLPIWVYTTLFESMCRAMPFSGRALEKKNSLLRWYCGKKQIEMWFIVVCTVIGMDHCDDAYRCP